jgi:hypothetical protein
VPFLPEQIAEEIDNLVSLLKIRIRAMGFRDLTLLTAE